MVGRLKARFETLTAGGHDQDLALGGVISARQQGRVQAYVDLAGGDDAPFIARGSVSPAAPDGGFYIAPALIGPVSPDHRLAQEEIFGPVLVCIRFDTEAEAIEIANGTDYGLAAGIWSRDGGRQMRVAKKMRCGQVFLNGYGAGGGIELPFGGIRKSGHGREKGFAALHEFSQIKTIVQNHGV